MDLFVATMLAVLVGLIGIVLVWIEMELQKLVKKIEVFFSIDESLDKIFQELKRYNDRQGKEDD